MSHDQSKPPGSEALDEQTIARLSDAITADPIAPELLARMRARVMAAAAAPSIEVVRAAEGEWRALIPGVSIKILRLDREQGTQTSLWRLAPGARIPPHAHSKQEECLVLEGVVVHDEVSYAPGDYLLTHPGVSHNDFVSPAGALLMIRGELLPNPLLLWIATHLPR